jgi:hypothetical protein
MSSLDGSGRRHALSVIYPLGKDPRYPQYRSLRGLQNRSRRRLQENLLPLPGIEPWWPGRPVRSQTLFTHVIEGYKITVDKYEDSFVNLWIDERIILKWCLRMYAVGVWIVFKRFRTEFNGGYFLTNCVTVSFLEWLCSLQLVNYGFVKVYTNLRNRVSSVSIVSDYGLDDRAIGVRFPAGAKDFSS